MARDPLLLDSQTPISSVPAALHIAHPQLRDVISCPNERGDVYYVATDAIVQQNLLEKDALPRSVVELKYTPVSLSTYALPAAAGTLIAAGGQDADIHISLLKPGEDPVWSLDQTLHGSINNSVMFTSHTFAPSQQSSVEPRLVVCNNDYSVKFFDVPVSSRGRYLKPAGYLSLDYPVNHCSISPDGSTLLSVGDSAKLYLHRISGGAEATFSKISSFTFPMDAAEPHFQPSLVASFSTAFSADGTKFAVTSQTGSVAIWDVRSTRPLKTFATDKCRGASSDDSLDWSRESSAPPWCVRCVKFGGGGREVMVFAEHTSLFHVVDARTFEAHETIKVPAAHGLRLVRRLRRPTPSPMQAVIMAGNAATGRRHLPRYSSPLTASPEHSTIARLVGYRPRQNARRLSTPSLFPPHSRRSPSREGPVIYFPPLGDEEVEADVRAILNNHGFRARTRPESDTSSSTEAIRALAADGDGDANGDHFNADDPDGDCNSSDTAEAARERALEMQDMDFGAGSSASLVPRHIPQILAPPPIVRTPDEDFAPQDAYPVDASISPPLVYDNHIGGICFDPSGKYIYVASSDGIHEWSVRGAEKQWWSSSALV
ncbi:hypothetical protein FISHEDRAFT_46987 [Fistulina hepatica ATCC 64428]|uniref:DUF2415 domain-containing protein n=1 Tax=Fistulina hepatica ATCC 64428 TaxID=1128425 RepID=A0A0D7A6I8_9AGAR|nr:hypothetical protein FISHEDRAFT_46987 [Fistulina hepatica ATCC 64428]